MIVHLTSDLLLASRVGTAADDAGLPIQTALTVAQAIAATTREVVTGLLIDLETGGLELAELFRQLPDRAQLCVVAYGPHVHAQLLEAATSAGCELVLTRGQLDRNVREVLARLAREVS
ncbi:MAG: hypothetical protein R3B90_06220 [Planctomycetaceae bacterium]